MPTLGHGRPSDAPGQICQLPVLPPPRTHTLQPMAPLAAGVKIGLILSFPTILPKPHRFLLVISVLGSGDLLVAKTTESEGRRCPAAPGLASVGGAPPAGAGGPPLGLWSAQV